MRRATIVITATVVGLVAVLSFHTKPARLTFGALPASTPARGSTPTSNASGSTTQQSSTGAGPAPAPRPTTTVPTGSRGATGAAVNYNYGVLSVSVKASGKKITNVSIASLDDGGNFRSQSIDQQSIPLLEQQAIQVQSANIQGVSGASYTSAGFAQSLQSALSKLGL